MAQNRRPEAEALDGSSSEEEEASSDDLEESSDSEPEPSKASTPMPKKPSPPQPQPLPLPQPSSSEESESESESESEPVTIRRPDPANIKPIASKPMEEDPPTSTTKKSRSKPSSATPVTTAVVKRAAEVENNGGSRESKRAKKTGDDDGKKQLFQRLWSEDDEIAILKGMIDYTAKKGGADPTADMNGFHDFIKKSLHVEVSNGQLLNKMRRLKKKYENNAGKGKNGQDRAFTKAHEQKSYELSKKLWGGEGNNGVDNVVGVDSKKGSGKPRKNQKENVAEPKVDGLASPDKGKEWTKMEVESNKGAIGLLRCGSRRIGGWGLEEETVKDGLELISGQKKLELEDKWKQLRVEEVKLYLKRLDLIREETISVLEALMSPEH